jgi:predicted RNA-binding protein YlxR (DUF448 family)
LNRSERIEKRDGPERTCIVTRAKGAPDEMIRFVMGPGALVVPDIRHKLPGRGVWVTANAAIVEEAVKRQAFARGFKTKVTASRTLAEEIAALLRQDCLQSLAIANKAGLVVTGFAKVEAAIGQGGVCGLVHASDAGADGTRKLSAVLKRKVQEKAQLAGGREKSGIPEIKLFDSAQLDLALGRSNVIHAALAAGAASAAFLTRCARLERFRSDALAEGPREDEFDANVN